MRTIALLAIGLGAIGLGALAACGAPPALSPLAVTAPAGDPFAWHLRGTARVVGPGIELHYCCVAWGAAERAIDVPPGRWRMQLAHRNTECRSAAHAFVFGADGVIIGGVPLDADGAGAVANLDFDVEGGGSKLVIGETGEGLACCGTTTVAAISIEPRHDASPRKSNISAP